MKTKLTAPETVRAEFSAWRTPRRGVSNPDIMTNPVWAWLVETNAWPYHAHNAAGADLEQTYPGWCFSRFGQSQTELPDGRVVYIGGEHEDDYDPDFYIYNDVIVRHPNGNMDIYGYPEDVFAPTDAHSATLLKDCILIVGSSGYPQQRDEATPIYRLDLTDFSIERCRASGGGPRRLYDHDARLSPDGQTLICSGGMDIHAATGWLVENLTTWHLDLQSLEWSSASTKPFTRWVLLREDDRYNQFWEIETIATDQRMGRDCKVAAEYRAKFRARGHVVDLGLYANRFSPPIPHERLPKDPDDFKTVRLVIDGTVVRIVEDMSEVTVTVEGPLPSATLEALVQFGLDTYSALEGVPYKVQHL